MNIVLFDAAIAICCVFLICLVRGIIEHGGFVSWWQRPAQFAIMVAGSAICLTICYWGIRGMEYADKVLWASHLGTFMLLGSMSITLISGLCLIGTIGCAMITPVVSDMEIW